MKLSDLNENVLAEGPFNTPSLAPAGAPGTAVNGGAGQAPAGSQPAEAPGQNNAPETNPAPVNSQDLAKQKMMLKNQIDLLQKQLLLLKKQQMELNKVH